MCSRSRGPSIGARRGRSACGAREGVAAGEAGEDREAFDDVTWRSFRPLANVRSRNNKPAPAARRFSQTRWATHARREPVARTPTSRESGAERRRLPRMLHDRNTLGPPFVPLVTAAKNTSRAVSREQTTRRRDSRAPRKRHSTRRQIFVVLLLDGLFRLSHM